MRQAGLVHDIGKSALPERILYKPSTLTSDEYASYMKGLERSPDLNLKLATAQRLEAVDQLVDDDFLIVSPAYAKLVEGAQRPVSDPGQIGD